MKKGKFSNREKEKPKRKKVATEKGKEAGEGTNYSSETSAPTKNMRSVGGGRKGQGHA